MSTRSTTSSIVSWLMEIKKCQITQLNWKVSTRSWKLHNEDTIEEVLTSAKDFFNERFNFKLFKDTASLIPFLHQGKINIIGLDIRSGTVTNMYGIITSLDADVSKYGSTTDKIEHILNELIRTAMLIHGYYDLSNGTIVFATPSINSSINGQLTDAVRVLNEIFKIYGFQFNFTVYINEEFTEHVLNSVAIRSKMKRVPAMGTKDLVGLKKNQKKDTNEHLRIGILVRNEMGKLAKNNQLANEMVQNLLDERYSKETFGINFPVLKKVVEDKPLGEQTTVNGLRRYWNMSYIINGEKYKICHSWSELQRPKFLNWLELISEKSSNNF
ncbi:hypothetical protein ABES02_28960 [Neobacillus pocheonensis]|uniref:hypothetical protein n=1 Tax=Neobacillus pocheonensis TaxID=363869 RepID=UPI003D26D2D7